MSDSRLIILSVLAVTLASAMLALGLATIAAPALLLTDKLFYAAPGSFSAGSAALFCLCRRL